MVITADTFPLSAADDHFLAVLAHEICNAVGPIRTGMELLDNKGIDAATSDWARGVVRRQVDQLVWMVQGIRDASRLRRGLIQLYPKPLPLDEIVRSGVEMAQPLIAGHEHTLIVDLEDDEALVHADPQRMAQVVAHLLHNAARFSVRPGRIWVSTCRDASGAVLTVRDEGIGIEAKTLPSIFDRFMSAAASERGNGGMGAGLTLVRGLTELHGGSVEVHSEGASRGSEFVIRMPCLPKPTTKSGTAKSGAAANQSANAPGVLRVLVVDDNVPAAKLLALFVERWRHEARLAHSGEDALAVAREFHPDVVLLDLGLPDIDGFEVAAALRARPELAATRLVAVTGYGDDRYRCRTQAAGFSQHLAKPITFEALREVLAQF